jgi:hypothetical protein
MMRFVCIVFILFFLNITCLSQTYTRVQGWAEQGGYDLRSSAVTIHEVQRSYPLSTITVYNAGTVTLSTIYTNSSGTIKSNPFTADVTAYWFFYAAPGLYDIRFSGFGVITPFTIPDVLVPTTAGSGTVISVGLSMPSEFTVSNSPITSTGVFGVNWVSQSPNLFLASPYSLTGVPSFRDIDFNDLEASDLGSGTANDTKYLRGDRTWQTLPTGFITQAYDRIQEEGSNLTQRSTINFIGTSITCIDNVGNLTTDCTLVDNTGTGCINATDGSVPYRTSSTTCADTPFFRKAANEMELRNGTTPTDLFIYKDWINSTNDYERLRIGGDTLSWAILSQADGTGTLRGMDFGASTIDFYTGASSLVNVWDMTSDGHLWPVNSNTKDVGENSRYIRSLWAGTSINLRMGTSAMFAKAGGIYETSTTTFSNSGVGEDDLDAETMDANGLSANNQAYTLQATGTFANNANTKRLKAYFGSAVIIDSGSLSPSGAGDWEINCIIVRTGAATQRASCKLFMNVTGVTTTTIVDYTTPTETLSSSVVIKLTGEGVDSNDISSTIFRIKYEPNDT